MTANDFDPSSIKAIAFDLDGTLLGSDKTIGGRTLRALRSCMDRGIQPIIATGRSCDSGERFRRTIGMSGPQVYYNGAEVADVDMGKIIYTRFIDPAPILTCVRMARRMGLYYQVYFPSGVIERPRQDEHSSGEVLMADSITAEAEAYIQSSGSPIMTGDLEEYLAKTALVIKGMFITDEKNHEAIRTALLEQYGDSIYIVRSSPVFLEVLAAGVSKGAGLAHALEYLNLKPQNTIAFGDEENDLPMFETAGFSAAPANAKEAVKNAAMFHIPSNSDEGVAAFLEEWFC